MRSNIPVTQIEHTLNDKATLPSTTDEESHITYTNSTFIDTSGFNKHQLVGEPHNIIRHPDVPPAAFVDMWYTLQQRDSWTGMVKNRRQNGDHYWIRANVTPIWHGEKLTGYISVRTVPSRGEITQSGSLYQRINNQQLEGFRLFKGIIVCRGILSQTSMFKQLNISQHVNYPLEVIALLAVLFLFVPVNPFIQAGRLSFLFLVLAIYLKYQICQSVNAPLTQMKKVISRRKSNNCHLNRMDRVGVLIRLVNQSRLNLDSLIDDVDTQISGIRAINQRVLREGTVLHKCSEETSADLQQTAAAIKEIGSAVQQTAEIVAHAMTMADKTNANAAEGGDIMKQAVAMMQAISRDNGQIIDVIGIIDSIAFQTNIPAFNAAVEAARAEEPGRGFVVVAAEVRNLAQHSASAAREIKQLVEKNAANVNSDVKMVEQTETCPTGMISDVLQMSMMIKNISLVTREQTQALDLINDSISHVGTMTHDSAEMVERVTDATVDLIQRSSRLQQAVQVFDVST